MIKQFFKSFCVAFSLYSKIPMPRFVWNSSDMKYHFAFFPLVGMGIALLEFVWKYLQIKFGFGEILYLCLAAALPILITGGIHLDGFMDTTDALCSYGSREKKLEILKDPHIGAFSVIGAAVYFLLLLGFGSEIKSFSALICVCFSFVFSRILSALGVLLLPKAKNDGMAKTESENSSKKIVVIILILEFVVFSGFMIFCVRHCEQFFLSYEQLHRHCERSEAIPLTVFPALAVSSAVTIFTAKKNFGGITGDIAGFFVCVSELLCVVAVSVCEIASRFLFIGE